VLNDLQKNNLVKRVSAIQFIAVTCLLVLFNAQLQAGEVTSDTASNITSDTTNHVSKQKPAFELIVLGDKGGIEDGNLSAFLLRGIDTQHYIGLDAGTLVNGINIA